jgi:hypothetical protein
MPLSSMRMWGLVPDSTIVPSQMLNAQQLSGALAQTVMSGVSLWANGGKGRLGRALLDGT